MSNNGNHNTSNATMLAITALCISLALIAAAAYLPALINTSSPAETPAPPTATVQYTATATPAPTPAPTPTPIPHSPQGSQTSGNGIITAYGDAVYCILGNDIIVCKNGKTDIVLQCKSKPSCLNASGGYLYYISGGDAYRTDILYGNTRKVAIDADWIGLCNGIMYMLRGGTLYGENAKYRADFAFISAGRVIYGIESNVYGYDLFAEGSDEPFVTQAAAYCEYDGTVYVECTDGFYAVNPQDGTKTQLDGMGFTRLPQTLLATQSGIIYKKRDSNDIYYQPYGSTAVYTVGNAHNIACLNGCLFTADDKLLVSDLYGWQCGEFDGSYPLSQNAGTLSCTAITADVPQSRLALSNIMYIKVYIDGAEADRATLEQLCIITGKTGVIRCTVTDIGIMTEGIGAGETTLRIAAANTVAEYAITVTP